MMRCFIAIKIPSDVAGRISDFSDRFLSESNLKLRAVPPQNYHVTIKFLGDTKEDLILPIKSELRCVAKSLDTSVQLFLNDLLFFPSASGRGSVVIRIDGYLKPIAHLIDKRMEKFGYRKSGKFAPHITIFRLKEKAFPLLTGYNMNGLSFKTDSFSLFESILTHSGSIYRELETFKWRKDER